MQFEGFSEVTPVMQSNRSRVFRAVRNSDSTPVVLKTPDKAYPAANELASLEREFDLLSLLQVTGVPRAYELRDNGRTLVLVQEYFEGISLREFLAGRAREAADLSSFFQIAIGLGEIIGRIHRSDVIHKDINPNNVLYSVESGELMLVDFGAAMAMPRQARVMTGRNVIEGTRAYMSPEQTGRINRRLDYRTDLYSLGVTLYEICTGRLPFQTIDANELIHCHIAVEPEPPHILNPAIPEQVSLCVLKLMNKEAWTRYQSAEGVVADLIRCKEQLEQTEQVERFALGRDDLRDRFALPDKLYGRADQLRLLQEAFEQAASGENSFVLVAGESGVGKTALVRELQRLIMDRSGYLVSGKFDQYQRNVPYSALRQAFSGLMKQLLAESDTRIAAWKQNLLEAFAGMGKVITDVIPELELVIGRQPDVAVLGRTEEQTRFNAVFTVFMEVFARQDHPLVLFLDDLQWIDASSLSLLETMAANKRSGSMLIIGAYRNNEVDTSHPLAITLRQLRESGVEIPELVLPPLSVETVKEIVEDTIPPACEETGPLGQMVHERTAGVPLVLRLFLGTLYRDGLVRFDYDKQCWGYDEEQVRKVPHQENALNLLKRQLESLETNDQKMVILGACIGNPFSLDMAAALSDCSRSETATRLGAAVSSGLLFPDTDAFEYVTARHGDQLPDMQFRFAHDRVQQAAYDLYDKEERPSLHLRIARMLAQQSDTKGGEDIFRLAMHYNLASTLVSVDSELRDIARFNLLAGRKARASAAYADATAFFQAGMEVLTEDDWTGEYDLSRDLNLEYAESLYLSGRFEEAEERYTLVEPHLASDSDLLALYNIQAKQYHHQGLFEKAVVQERKGLALLDIVLPDTDEELLELFGSITEEIFSIVEDRDIQDLINNPELKDQRLFQTQELVFDVFVEAYLMGRGPLVIAASALMARLALTKGHDAMSSVAYINFASSLCAAAVDYEAGYQFGKLAVRLAEKYRVAPLQNYTYHVFSLGVNHWKAPLSESFSYWRKASKLALESGSPYSGYVFLQLAHVLLASGTPLEEVQAQEEESREFLEGNQLGAIVQILDLIVTQPLKHLKGETDSFESLDDDFFNTKALLEQYAEAPFYLGSLYYPLLRVSLMNEHYLAPADLAERLAVIEATQQGQIIMMDAFFYGGLHMSGGYDVTTSETRDEYAAKLDEIIEKFALWSDLGGISATHKYTLLCAEKARISGDIEEALSLYDKAIDQAYQSGFLHDAALAGELAGRFWLQRGRERLAVPYLEQSLAAYERWGAVAKVRQMEAVYGQRKGLLNSKKESETVSSISTSSEVIPPTGAWDFSMNLDMMAVIKASQAISSFIVMDKLAHELTSLAVENAGATKGVLMLKQDSGYRVEAWVEMGVEPNGRIGSLYSDVTGLSQAVVNYVVRTGKHVSLNDLTQDTTFSQCPHIAAGGPRSIACLPILRQGNLFGVLYLENSHMADSFQEERLQVLQILSSQASISLENAKVYQELDALNQSLENKVRERTLELREKNEQLNVQNRELERLSTTDQLTGICNRRYLEQQLHAEIERADRYGQELSVVLFDLDNFKRINDTFGHAGGDEVLVRVGGMLLENARSSDICGRWGGEEFLVILPSLTGKDAVSMAEKLRATMETATFDSVGQTTASFGVSSYTQGDSLSSLVKRADAGLYKAKEEGRNKVVLVSD